MLNDGREVTQDHEFATDLLVIGAGAAGISIARELSGSQLQVLLLESGGLEFEAATNDLNRGTSTGLPYFPLEAARLRYFGGSTNHWGGYCRTFEAVDFEPRAGIPLTGWPIRRADLDRYYERARDLVKLPVGRFDLEFWTSHDRTAPWPLAVDRMATVLAEIVPRRDRSFGTRYREELDAAPNVNVLLHSNAVEIEPDAGGRHVERVHVATLTGRRFTVRPRATVVAGGGIENARLLLASNRVQPGGLGNDRDMVGRCFLEHPRFLAGTLVPTDRGLSTRFYEVHPAAGGSVIGYLSPAAELMEREQMVEVQIRMDPVHDPAVTAALEGEDVEALRDLAEALRSIPRQGPAAVDGEFARHVARVAEDLASWQQAVIPGGPLAVPLPEVIGEVARHAGEGDLDALVPLLLGDVATLGYREVAGSLPVTQVALRTRLDPAPNRESRVRLGSERDPLGMPRAELHWALSPIDKWSAIRALEILGAEVGRLGLGRVQVLIEDDDTWPADMTGGWHHMGTTRMSDDPATGVVDRDLKVHGVDNLWIAGSSTFATAGSGTPTVAIVALALRLADHLRERLA